MIDYINNCYFTKLATGLLKFRNTVYDLIDPIIIYWCLTKWAEEHPEHELAINRNSWADELKKVMTKVSRIKLKSGRKKKTLSNLLINDIALDNSTSVSQIIRKTFSEYGLQKYIVGISYECAENMQGLCEAMSMNSENVEDYCCVPLG